MNWSDRSTLTFFHCTIFLSFQEVQAESEMCPKLLETSKIFLKKMSLVQDIQKLLSTP